MKSDARKKLVYVVSNLEKSLAFEWLADYLHLHFNLTFILLNPASSYFETFLNERSINYIRITYRGKKDFFGALAKTVKYFVLSKPDIIHTHLFDAQLVGLIAAKITGIRQRIYTRHNSNFHQKYFPSAVKYDKLSNLLATSIISISQATDKTLLELEKAPLKKIVKIPHGFKFDAFTNIKQERIEEIRLKWDIPVSGPVIGVVARQIEWKGIQYTIQAFKKYLFQFPDACLVMANATGPFQKEIYSRLEELPLSAYRLIPFESDIAALYKLFHYYVHVPVDTICEAFGQTYIEALISGIPSVFTLSGIASEFLVHRENAWIADFRNVDSILDGMLELSKNKLLAANIVEKGRADVMEKFGIDSMFEKLNALYSYE